MTDSYKDAVKMVVFDALREYAGKRDAAKGDMIMESGSFVQNGQQKSTSVFRQRWEEEGKRCLKEGQWEALEYLFALFCVDSFERFCVALALVWELAPEYGRLAEKPGESGAPTVGLAMELYGPGAHWDSFFSGSVLWRYFLEASTFLKGRGRLEQPIKLRERVLNFVLGQWENPAIARWARLILPEKRRLASHGEAVYRGWSRGLCSAVSEPQGRAYVLCGPAGIGKKTQLLRLAMETGTPFFCVNRRKMALLPDLEEAFSELLWECQVHRAYLAFTHWNPSEGREEEFSMLAEQAALELGTVFLLSEEDGPEEFDGIPFIRTSIPMPSMAEERELWNHFAGEYLWREPLRTGELAGLFSLTPGKIQKVLKGTVARAGSGGADTGDVKAFCRESLSGSVGGRLCLVPLKFSWKDLILPDEVKGLLLDACNQVTCRYHVYEAWGLGEKIVYGTGTSMAFSGSPGTGKTMAAQVIAAELGLPLYRIDLAFVVSKYIGETEKNLTAVFEEGKKSQAVLFFDEADVLFSKRTEVREANDKYSNMEAAFLLQKMEEYGGVVILATNYIQNIDEVFKRRLTFLVEFPFPDVESRRRLWRSIVPEGMALCGDVDMEFLAERFALSGSQIKNSLRSGAFLAAAAGLKEVSMGHLLLAVQRELIKSGKKLSYEDFGEYAENLRQAEAGSGKDLRRAEDDSEKDLRQAEDGSEKGLRQAEDGYGI